MKAGTMFPSRWLQAADAEDEDLVLTIKKVRQETVGQGAEAEQKWALYFHDHDKGLILNKTNVKTLVTLYGDDTDDWIDKPIALFAADVQFKGDMVAALRIRPRAPKMARNGNGAKPKTRPAADDDEEERDVFATDDDE